MGAVKRAAKVLGLMLLGAASLAIGGAQDGAAQQRKASPDPKAEAPTVYVPPDLPRTPEGKLGVMGLVERRYASGCTISVALVNRTDQLLDGISARAEVIYGPQHSEIVGLRWDLLDPGKFRTSAFTTREACGKPPLIRIREINLCEQGTACTSAMVPAALGFRRMVDYALIELAFDARGLPVPQPYRAPSAAPAK